MTMRSGATTDSSSASSLRSSPRLVLFVLAGLLCSGWCHPSSAQVQRAPDDSSGWDPHFFLDAAFLGSRETEVLAYKETDFRFHCEAGVDWGRRLRWGPALSFAMGRHDVRHRFGPRLTWSMSKHWAVQAIGGPAKSNYRQTSVNIGSGWHARAGLLYRNAVSLTVMWEGLSYRAEYAEKKTGTLHCYQAGLMFHRGAGTVITLSVWGVASALGLAHGDYISQ